MSPQRTTVGIPVAVLTLLCAACQPVSAGRQIEQASVYVKVEAFGPDDRPASYTGSRVCLPAAGLIVTNQHVVRLANAVRVVFHAGTADEFESPAEVLAVHPDRDLALLRCDSRRPWESLPLGSTHGLHVADPVRCIGYPLGMLLAEGWTATAG